ncbi:MAG TPA: cytochrome c peroxidase [Flavitalea sp.]|nr:cytochrome c peroxidase [Flavitalea sp.]
MPSAFPLLRRRGTVIMKVYIILCLVVTIGLIAPPPPEPGMEHAIIFFKQQSEIFAQSTVQLQLAIAGIKKGDSQSVINARGNLRKCRLNYKNIEFFLEYFFKSSALVYNMAPKAEVEEPFMEYQEPTGLQVIEGLLFENNAASRKAELIRQADVISSSAKDINSLLYGFRADDKQLFESIRIGLIRIITLGITGFDAPILKSGIAEARISLIAAQHVLQPFLEAKTTESDSVAMYLNSGIQFLTLHTDFDDFNRLLFLTQHALPLQRHLGLLIKKLGLELNTTGGVLNYDASDIFDKRALNINSFPSSNHSPDTALIQLGKKLFFEPELSGNSRISCATCHDPSRHFTDNLAKSIAFDGHSHVQRNAPSLLYSGFQYQQFWDGRAVSLEEQIALVINDTNEMNGGPLAILAMQKRNPEYVRLFKEVFQENADTLTLINKVTISLAAFVRSLNPRNSRFDKYIEDSNVSILTSQEIKGFNLFMGKGQCGTCHFAPLFNGLTPPLYNLSELEVLGTTKTDDLNKPELDSDGGRFNIFPIEAYEKAFKTPSVRNVSATGPYMHNGSFKTLETVMEFYNKGGGKGLGLHADNQTLSSSPLNLTEKEISDIIAFLHTLEDSVIVDFQKAEVRNKKTAGNNNN